MKKKRQFFKFYFISSFFWQSVSLEIVIILLLFLSLFCLAEKKFTLAQLPYHLSYFFCNRSRTRLYICYGSNMFRAILCCCCFFEMIKKKLVWIFMWNMTMAILSLNYSAVLRTIFFIMLALLKLNKPSRKKKNQWNDLYIFFE